MNLKNAFLSLEKYFSPKIIGEVNDQYIKVVKIKGQEVPWHIHENEDELFYIAKGTLLMEIENQPDLKFPQLFGICNPEFDCCRFVI